MIPNHVKPAPCYIITLGKSFSLAAVIPVSIGAVDRNLSPEQAVAVVIIIHLLLTPDNNCPNLKLSETTDVCSSLGLLH